MLKVVLRLKDARTDWVVAQCSRYSSILDVGAAQGHVFRDSGLNVTLLDLNEFEPCEFPQIVADAHDLPLEDGSFDCCVLAEILEHVHNPTLVLKEAVRVAKRAVVFTVPDEYDWPSDIKPFESTLDKMVEKSGKSVEDTIRESFPTIKKIRDTSQIYHNRWYTKELLEARLDYIGLPYEIEVVKNYPGHEAYSWFCGVIESHD